MQMPADQYVDVDGIKTHYWSVGAVGSPILLIHGAGGSVDYWHRNIFTLAQQHQVYALDWVGSGKSDKPAATYTYDDLTQFVAQFMDAVGLSSANLVATSGGGIIAMKLASRSPHRVQKLVLSGSAGLGKELGFGMRVSAIPGIGEVLNRPSRATIVLQRNISGFFVEFDRLSVCFIFPLLCPNLYFACYKSENLFLPLVAKDSN
jgi:pimeloyl-ACP methyl ester carboxylesterase